MDNKLRIGIVGCGRHMFEFLYNCLRWAHPVSVVAACDIDEKRLDKFTGHYNIPTRYTDFNDMFEKESLDAILCVINPAMHYEVCKAAMLAGIDVFVEKTPCVSTTQAEELLQIQRQTGKTTMVGFNRRFTTSYVMAKQISESPEFGGVHMFQSQFNASPYKSDADFKLSHIIHHFDLARFMLGEIKLTHAQRVILDDTIGHTQVGYTISFQTEQGTIGSIQSGSLLDEMYPMERLELLGNKQNIVVENIRNFVYNRPPGTRREQFRPYNMVEGGDALVWNSSLGLYPRFSYYGYEDEIFYFIDCLTHGRKPEPNFEDTIHTMRLLDDLDALLQ
ncbi:Gfo/Idh/MocA family protein [Paenibacillus thalictri]|uniref:Gfo/Idh/MocA family oxidoreductase n=1 Tax=Paenibacillus thalictri TaxID=2527873 RepID=A0A4Q9DSN4_9BACL|nr:Gfo/Idh/MocA family oxidoreductase [Paenibacillus thalictri]TBL79096.1 Gfo/Idh/MocA family oxidoreductase [Paenibacillus thalictri]